MKDLVNVSVGAAFILLLPLSVQAQSGQPWLKDFDQATATAREQGVNLLIHFHASWCGPCKVMDRNVLNTSEVVKALSSGLVGVKVDTDRRKDLVRKFGIKTIPADVFVSPDGKVLARYSGQKGRLSYVASLKRYQVEPQLRDQPLQQDSLLAEGRSPQTQHVSANPKGNKPTAPKIQRVSVQPTKLTKALRTVEDRQLGLGGYCPVSLSASLEWKAGRADIVHEFDGVIYRFANAALLKKFQSDPESYVPVLHGCDAVTLEQHKKMQSGAIELGARFRKRLYFFESQANRDAFLKSPKQFVQDAAVSVVQSQSDRNPGL